MRSLCTTCKDKVACDAHRRCYGYPNYRVTECIGYEPKDEPTCSILEQVDKDINVRSKDCETCKWGEDKRRYAHICNECGVGINNYEPKDEPQTNDLQDWKDRMWAEAIVTEPQAERSEP